MMKIKDGIFRDLDSPDEEAGVVRGGSLERIESVDGSCRVMGGRCPVGSRL